MGKNLIKELTENLLFEEESAFDLSFQNFILKKSLERLEIGKNKLKRDMIKVSNTGTKFAYIIGFTLKAI